MPKINFLEETIDELLRHDKSTKDVHWIGIKDTAVRATWDEFAELANFDYDNGFGGNEINMNVIVVGDTWWLERHEYDGKEWWEYKEKAMMPDPYFKLEPEDLKEED
jgi:hypothetical protein